jgi:uncharacterized protein YndB with AHSA1/START domain
MCEISSAPVVRQQMLIRRPVSEVYRAFTDPAVTTHFWFSRSSGMLEAGRTVRWDWEIYGVGTDVEVKALEENRRILIAWDGIGGRETVEWRFEERSESATMVIINCTGFTGAAEEMVAQALDSMGGFSFVLSAAKAWLEHGIELNLVADRAPEYHA